MLTSAFSQLLFYRPRGKLTNYLISLITVGVAVAVEYWIFGWEITYLGFLLWLFLAVIVSSVLGGLYSGLSAIALSLLCIFAFTLFNTTSLVSLTREVQTLVYILASFIASYIVSAVKSTYQITISILNSLQSYTIILSPRGVIVDINQAALSAFGIKRSAVVGRSIMSDLGLSYSNESRRKLRAAIVEAREGQTGRFDMKVTTPTGQALYLDFSIAPIYDRQQNVISFAVSANDITARVMTERKVWKLNETLEQKFNELETLFNLLPIGVGISRDAEGNTVTINPALSRMLNLKTGATGSLMNNDTSKNRSYAFYRNGKALKLKDLPMKLAATKGLTTQEVEAQIVRSDGESLDVLQYAMPIKDESEDVVGSIGAFVDITEFKKIAAQLRESQSQFKALLNANLIGIIVAELDQEGKILEANDAFCSMTGYTQNQIKAGEVSWRNLTPPGFEVQDEQAIEELLTKGETLPYEKEYLKRDGTRLPILIGAVTADGHMNTCVAFILDITARKILEKRKDEFIGLASHELKTPLTSMKVFTQLLQRSMKTGKKVQSVEYVDKMNRQIHRLTALIDELLDVSKIEAGQLQLNLEPFNLNHLVTETVNEIQTISPNHTFKVTGTIKKAINGDAFRIKQVILNLLTNAVKYAPQAGQITIHLSENKDEVKMAVNDRGVGIPEVDQKRIFEKFFRAGGKNKHSFPGLGLGLYLSKRIIEQHGGRIWLTSTEGQGSTFTFSLCKKVPEVYD